MATKNDPKASPNTASQTASVSRSELVELLNQDLAREYQAIISYVVYSQVLKGAEFMNIAAELEKHAQEELQHAIVIAKQIDYLGGMPTVTPRQVKASDQAREMLRIDLSQENETVRGYRDRVDERCHDATPFWIWQQVVLPLPACRTTKRCNNMCRFREWN